MNSLFSVRCFHLKVYSPCAWAIILFLVSFSFFEVHAAQKDSLAFSLGDELSLYSDKGHHRLSENKIEAIGNVVILHYDEALYGEAASLSLTNGDVSISGNVRYISKDMTVYGSNMKYNFKTSYLQIDNARVITPFYNLLARSIERTSPGVYVAKDAEYSTCRDCPESWSIFGNSVRIEQNEYVRINHAMIKVNGVSVMYLPYVVFPIKKERQTGLLFPKFGYSFKNAGVQYRQPWYWVISPYSDATITPGVLGKRGLSNEFEFRKVFGEDKWMEVNSLSSRDQLYRPYEKERNDENGDLKTSGNSQYRLWGDYEHHFEFGNNVNHHLYANALSDKDMVRDYAYYNRERLQGSHTGAFSFLEGKTQYLNFGVEAWDANNLISPNRRKSDAAYVQILPKLSLDTIPVSLLKTDLPFLHNITVGGSGTYTVFKQQHPTPNLENSIIRNAQRATYSPYIDWQLLNIGPVNVKTKVDFKYEDYRFPYQEEKTFQKYGTLLVTEASFEMEKIMGLAYKESIPTERVKGLGLEKDDLDKGEKKTGDKRLVGNLPSFEKSHTEDFVVREERSYRYGQEYKLIHYATVNDKVKGNERFASQIKKPQGQFDDSDAIHTEEHESATSLVRRTEIPKKHSLEVQWNNSFIQKTATDFNLYEDERYLRNNFSYLKIAYFDVSQGIELNSADELTGEKLKTQDKLTRLKVSTGFSLDPWSLSFTEYYFYQTQKNNFVSNFARTFRYGQVGIGSEFNSNAGPDQISRKISLNGTLAPVDLLSFTSSYAYDYVKNERTEFKLDALYKPHNNCWILDLGYQQTPDEKEIRLDFLLNLSNQNFISVLAF